MIRNTKIEHVIIKIKKSEFEIRIQTEKRVRTEVVADAPLCLRRDGV